MIKEEGSTLLKQISIGLQGIVTMYSNGKLLSSFTRPLSRTNNPVVTNRDQQSDTKPYDISSMTEIGPFFD